MSIVTYRKVECDGCGLDAPNPLRSSFEARKSAAFHGWTNKGSTDLCPNCSARAAGGPDTEETP